MLRNDVSLADQSLKDIIFDQHASYLDNYVHTQDKAEKIMSEYLKMSGIYWGITAMDLIGKRDKIVEDPKEIVNFILSCKHSCGGISASEGHDPHMLYTLSAIQILAILDQLNDPQVDVEGMIKYICSLQQPDGSFCGDQWGEIDIRFSFCAIASLTILKALDRINVPLAVEFIVKCQNPIDGGFGSRPGSESHAGLIYCAVGALSLTKSLNKINAEILGWWLSERQLPSGGLNGRPEKLPDLCYSWWVLSSLKMLGRSSWIKRSELLKFMIACQDSETGGFTDRPGNQVDPFHTLFGLAGLSLLVYDQYDHDESNLDRNLRQKIKEINPVLCIPQEVVDRLGIQMQYLSL